MLGEKRHTALSIWFNLLTLKKKIMSKEKSGSLTASEAVRMIKSIETAGDVKSFVRGDDRKTVSAAADARIQELKSKKKDKKDKTTKATEKAPTKKSSSPR